MQIDLSHVRGARIDPKTRTAYVAGGSHLADLDHEAMAQGLVTTAGTVSHTGVGGLTLGGGFGRVARRFGLALARGMSVDAAVASVGQVVEGAETTRQVARAGKRLGVELPIVEQVYRVIYDGRPPLEAVNALLGRPRGSEGV